MAESRPPDRRSACPLNISLEMIGDRWSLLVLRDLMLRGCNTYQQFLQCPEKIATNILADRLKKLIDNGIITTQPDPADGRKRRYRLTEKGIDLAPVITELVLWAARHEQTGNQQLIDQLRRDKAGMIAAVRRQWESGQSANLDPNARSVDP